MGTMHIFKSSIFANWCRNSDRGVIRTLDNPVYLTGVRGRTVHCLDRAARPRVFVVNPTEYRFKLALQKRDHNEVLHVIRTSDLIGKAIIVYLQEKGFPEIALHFVQDKQLKFELALESGNMEAASEMASALNVQSNWEKLASHAMMFGNFKVCQPLLHGLQYLMLLKVSEKALQKTRDFAKLSFLYLITGDVEKLAKMMQIAEQRNDHVSCFQNALFLGRPEMRVQVLREKGRREHSTC